MPKPLLEIQLENFRAFRGEDFKLPVAGKNVLIYGENGAGKTSIWTALNAMFETALTPVLTQERQEGEEGENTTGAESRSRQSFIPHRYLWFDEETDARVLLTLEGFEPFEWSANATPRSPQVEGHEEFVAAAKTRACLDYRGLWETYFLQRDGNTVDIWPLILTLLADAKVTISNVSLKEHWEVFEPLSQSPTKVSKLKTLQDARRDFRTDLKLSMKEILHEAQKILSVLDKTIDIRLLTFPPDYQVVRGKSIYTATSPRVFLRVRLNGRKVPNHHNLLNEARLSALAIAIYLGAAKVRERESRAKLKILALDDVLIGLDMSHRIPMLKVLDQFFSDWQIFLFTYDFPWYEVAKQHYHKSKDWKNFEFFATPDVPVWGEDKGLVEKAQFYLQRAGNLLAPDYRAAGVYARAAFEMMLKWFCNEQELPVQYSFEGRHELKPLWEAVENTRLGKDKSSPKVIPEHITREINRFKTIIYNPLCHTTPINFHQAEVDEAVAVLSQLQSVLLAPRRNSVASNLTEFIETPIERWSDKKLNALPFLIKKEAHERTKARGALISVLKDRAASRATPSAL